MIYLIRHGQTELNNAQVLQGRSDYPLNEAGIRQARETARRLNEQGIRFSHVYSSPLIRAVQTAEIVVPGIQPVLDDRLLEMDYGPYEGADLRHPPAEIVAFFRDFVNNPAPEGMEPLSSVVTRAGMFLETCRDMTENVLISTHAIAMKGALEYLTPESGGRYWSKYIGNCAVYVVDNTGGHFSVPKEFEMG